MLRWGLAESLPQRRRVQLIKNKQISEMHETGAKRGREKEKEKQEEGEREGERTAQRVAKTVNEQCGPCGTGQCPRLAGRLQTGRDSRQAGDKSCRSKRFLMQRTDFFALLQDTHTTREGRAAGRGGRGAAAASPVGNFVLLFCSFLCSTL